MLATTNSFMHADQDQPRNKIGKNTKEDSLYERNYKIPMFDKSGKALSKNIIPSGTTKRQVIL
jgi:uncharacterized protein YxeA